MGAPNRSRFPVFHHGFPPAIWKPRPARPWRPCWRPGMRACPGIPSSPWWAEASAEARAPAAGSLPQRRRQPGRGGLPGPAAGRRGLAPGSGAAAPCTERRRPLLVEGVSRAEAVAPLASRLAAYVDAQLDDDTEATLFCIFDALVPNIATHLDAWYLALADRVHYAGVNAGSERFVAIPLPVRPGALHRRRRAAAASAGPPGRRARTRLPGARTGHHRHLRQRATASSRSTGGRPWRSMGEMMASQYGVSIDRDNFYTYAVHFPFGILRGRRRGAGAHSRGPGRGRRHHLRRRDSAKFGADPARRPQRRRALRAPSWPPAWPPCRAPAPTCCSSIVPGAACTWAPAGMDRELAELARRLGPVKLWGALSLGEIGGRRLRRLPPCSTTPPWWVFPGAVRGRCGKTTSRPWPSSTTWR